MLTLAVPAFAAGTPKLVSFGPWRGCVTTREKIALASDELADGSLEWQIDPADGRLVRRGGSTIQIDALTGSPSHESVGALESSWGARAHQFVPLHSPSITDGYETPSWVVANEVGKEGTLAWIDRDLSAFNQLGKTDFDTTASGHYKQTGGGTEITLKAIPYVAENAAIDYARFNSAVNRKFPLAGSRRCMETDRGFYSPGEQCVPYWWNKRRNPTKTTGTERVRFRPWGLDMPLWAPTTTVGSPVAPSAGHWSGGTQFYEAWQFVYADGSRGPPFAISTTAATPSKGGLVKVGVGGSTVFYASRTISNIPLGPIDGPAGPCVARIGYRSLQVTDSTEGLPDPSTLYPFAIIEDNTSTSMVDYNGSDLGLTTSADDLNNQTWPPRAQYSVAVNGRAILGGRIRYNPYALIIAPTGGGASRDMNLPDTNTTGLYGTVYYHVRITSGASGHLYLRRTSGGTTNSLDIDFATYTTLQAVKDKINETLFSDSYDEWACQIAPGVDGNTPSQYLRATTDCGDDGRSTAPTDGTTGNVRAYCPTFYFAAAFTEAYLATLPTDESGIWLSDGDAATGDGHYALFRVRPGDRKFPPATSVGKLMGIEPCTAPNGVVAILFYERGRFALRNVKGGGSGDNADFQIVPLDLANGCISWLSCFSGKGFAGCVGQDGVWATEGTPGAALELSRDMYQQFPAPGQLAGELAYAIRTDAALAAKGSDTYTVAQVLGDRIRVRYRTQSVGSTYTDSGIDYWFGQGHDASGLSELLRLKPDGSRSLYGWSCPNRSQKVGVHGITTDNSGAGRHTFAWQETNQGSTGDGRVDEVDKGGTVAPTANDNGTAFLSSAYTASMLSDPFTEIGILEADPVWRKNGTGLSISVYGDVDLITALWTLTLGSSGTSVMKRNRFKSPGAARGNLQACGALISDDGTGSGAVEVRALPIMLETKSAETRYP